MKWENASPPPRGWLAEAGPRFEPAARRAVDAAPAAAGWAPPPGYAEGPRRRSALLLDLAEWLDAHGLPGCVGKALGAHAAADAIVARARDGVLEALGLNVRGDDVGGARDRGPHRANADARAELEARLPREREPEHVPRHRQAGGPHFGPGQHGASRRP